MVDWCDMAVSYPKDWTALSYARAMGKYGLTTEKVGLRSIGFDR